MMYLDFYHLSAKPFQITCDPKFLWLGEKHKEALSMLHFGILDNRGFLLLTGEVGTGKTLLVNQLLTRLPKKTVVANVSVPKLNRIDFYQILAHRLKFQSSAESKASFLLQFQEYLHEAAAEGRQVVLIIDEAQALDHQALEDIRLLSNIEFPDKKLLSIFLVGQQELNQTLLAPENRALAQRITMRYHLEPLDPNEIAAYVGHRLKVAGCTRIPFSAEAIHKIYELTAGIPRLINILCDHALLTGSVRGMAILDEDAIDECGHELRIPDQQNNSATVRSTFQTPDVNLNPGQSVRPPEQKPIAGKEGWQPVSHGISNTPKRPRRAKWLVAGLAHIIILSLVIIVIHVNGGSTPLMASKTEAPVRHDEPNRALPDTMIASDAKPDQPESPEHVTKKKLFIQLSATHQIDGDSLAALDRVAKTLADFPEQVVYVYGISDETEPSPNGQAILRQRANAVKSHLINKGAFAYQIQIITEDTGHAVGAGDLASGFHAVVEFQPADDANAFNQDK